MNLFTTILLFALLTIIGLAVLYKFVFAISSLFQVNKRKEGVYKKNRFLVLVPAYKEDEVILKTSKRNLKVDYPDTDFDICVIADHLDPDTISRLKKMGTHVHKVEFKKSTKVKALQSAMKAIDESLYQGVVVLDADNIMDKNFLKVASRYLSGGCKIMQGRRVAANLNTSTAVYDAISEDSKNKMLGKGANNFGLSSKLSGSGIIFETTTFLDVIFKQTAIGGFDTEMELQLTKSREYIHYVDTALVLDEKVDSLGSYSIQRGRWLEAQHSFLHKFSTSGISELKRGNWDHFHKVMQLAIPPAVLMDTFLIIITAIALLVENISVIFLSVPLFVMSISTYLILIPRTWIKKYGLELLIAIPGLVLATLKAVWLMSKAKKEFLHTVHKNVT